MRELSDDEMKHYNFKALRKFIDIIDKLKIHISSTIKPSGKLNKGYLGVALGDRVNMRYFGSDEFIIKEGLNPENDHRRISWLKKNGDN